MYLRFNGFHDSGARPEKWRTRFQIDRREADKKFVTSIGGVDNLVAAGDNWVYRVNGKLGDKSSGLYPVEPGDEVLWVFGKYSEPEND